MTAASAARIAGPPPGFSRVVTLSDPVDISSPRLHASAERFCEELEAGNILFLPVTPMKIPSEDRKLLMGRWQATSAFHKNISYRPQKDRLSGLDAAEEEMSPQLRRILRNYSEQARLFVDRVLAPYAGKWKLEYASFRAIEERGRAARLHARNDLLHFDSFPTRPTNGSRILRFFTNVNPIQSRVWLTSQTFEAFGPRFAPAADLPKLQHNPLKRGLFAISSRLGIPGVSRPPYDELMHRCHNAMKEDAHFQETTPKYRWEFPPNSTWLVFTDTVSHAVLQGQYALEQTFLIPQSALVQPQCSPLAILEQMSGQRLTL